MVAATVALGTTSMVVSAMAKAVQSLYSMAGDINTYLDKHIEEMSASENPTIARSGRVMSMAKYGFGIGYITPVIVISAGQLLLGNTMAAIGTVATAATLTNPIAMTCAAIGAIYYGWGALSNIERNEILEKLSKGLEIGIALITAIVDFVVGKTKELLSSKNFEEMKKLISSAAAVFGKTLGDVTHKLADVASDSFDAVKKKSGEVAAKTGDLAGSLANKAGQVMENTAALAGQTYDTVKGAGKSASDSTMGAMDLNGDGKVDLEDLKIAMKRKPNVKRLK